MALGTPQDTPYTEPRPHELSRRPTRHTDAQDAPVAPEPGRSVGVSEHARRARARLGGGLARRAAALRAHPGLYVLMELEIAIGLEGHRANELLRELRGGFWGTKKGNPRGTPNIRYDSDELRRDPLSPHEIRKNTMKIR